MEFYADALDMSQWSLTFEVRKRRVATTVVAGGANPSQWSLTFEVRKRDLADMLGLTPEEVAMEPDL